MSNGDRQMEIAEWKNVGARCSHCMYVVQGNDYRGLENHGGPVFIWWVGGVASDTSRWFLGSGVCCTIPHSVPQSLGGTVVRAQHAGKMETLTF